MSLAVDFHRFHLAEPDDALYNAGGQVIHFGGVDETDVGFELDVTVSWQVDQRTSVTAGVSRLAPGTFLERSGSAEHVHFFYTQVRYDFTP